jgi:hypothetical protein
MLYSNKPGPCVRLTKKSVNSEKGGDVEWIVPFSNETKFTATQKFKKPIKDFFDALKDALVNNADFTGSPLSIVAAELPQILDLFGVKLFSRLYYAQGWVGEEPMPFSVTLDFFRGMRGEWNALKEVYNPIITLIAHTVPYDGVESTGQRNGAKIESPSPSSFDVFVAFSEEIITGALTEVANGANAIGVGTVVGPAISLAKTGVTSLINVLSNISGGRINPNRRVWRVEFGWCDGNANGVFIPAYVLDTCIVESSTWSFSTMGELQKDATGRVLPIKGSVTLSFKTQNIITYGDINPDNKITQ